MAFALSNTCDQTVDLSLVPPLGRQSAEHELLNDHKHHRLVDATASYQNRICQYLTQKRFVPCVLFVTNNMMSHSIPLHILIHGRVPSDYHWTDWN
ncbi:hypothetical protein T05_13009 [Trichinella murrelli]|uniref:Uncharacterized protein n=1 Tax=Trichinella murrelli TaxID=144512 RepID=A0A0V0TH30_9BILA|nr:hypothetical protein T05_13009 [Trichinella murrelli]